MVQGMLEISVATVDGDILVSSFEESDSFSVDEAEDDMLLVDFKVSGGSFNDIAVLVVLVVEATSGFVA